MDNGDSGGGDDDATHSNIKLCASGIYSVYSPSRTQTHVFGM